MGDGEEAGVGVCPKIAEDANKTAAKTVYEQKRKVVIEFEFIGNLMLRANEMAAKKKGGSCPPVILIGDQSHHLHFE